MTRLIAGLKCSHPNSIGEIEPHSSGNEFSVVLLLAFSSLVDTQDSAREPHDLSPVERDSRRGSDSNGLAVDCVPVRFMSSELQR